MALTKVPSNLDATIATTQSQADNSTNIATTAYVDLAVSSLSDSAPAALNTLNEIAAALGDDANYASTTTAAIAAKLPLAGGTMTGNLTVNAIVDADNYTINGGQGSDGQVLTSTGSGVAWEAIPAGGVDGIVSSANATAITIDSAETIFHKTTSPTLHPAVTGIVFENGSLLNDVTRGDGKSITLAQNLAIDSGNTWTYLAAGEGSYYQQFNGNHYFGTAVSGSAGADATVNTKMFIDSTGKVGIGTTAPDYPIHVKGAGHQRIKVEKTDAGGDADISIACRSDGIGWVLFTDAQAGNNAGVIKYVHNGDYMSFRTNGTDDRMRITSNGNVGIGTTDPGSLLEVSHSAASNTPVLRLTGTHASAYSGGLEFYSGYGGGKSVATMHATASGSQGGEYFQEVRNHSTNTLKRVRHISNAAKHTFYGQHNGDSTGHFLFTNSIHDTASTNCSLVVQNGYTFIQVMGWTSLGARIGTRTGGWSGNSGGDVYFTRQDATSIKLASSGPQLGNGTAISSDRRLKENITNLADGQLAKINSLTPRTFTWKDTRKPGTHEGFIAQEVEAVIPEAVFEDNFAPDPDDDSRDFEVDCDIKLIKHEVINARLIKAVQELSAKLEAAEARITTLENA